MQKYIGGHVVEKHLTQTDSKTSLFIVKSSTRQQETDLGTKIATPPACVTLSERKILKLGQKAELDTLEFNHVSDKQTILP